ncbi:unnamed protein product, partial [Citrullus colocynthis]
MFGEASAPINGLGLSSVYQCLEGGVITVLQSYVDEDIRRMSDVGAFRNEYVRLWNVHTGIRILVLAGAGVHRNELCNGQHCKKLVNERILDISGKILYLDKSSIKVSHQVFISSVHSNYVDCSRWFVDFILSKRVDYKIVSWELKKRNSHLE